MLGIEFYNLIFPLLYQEYALAVLNPTALWFFTTTVPWRSLTGKPVIESSLNLLPASEPGCLISLGHSFRNQTSLP